jgi:hypothetical protein
VVSKFTCRVVCVSICRRKSNSFLLPDGAAGFIHHGKTKSQATCWLVDMGSLQWLTKQVTSAWSNLVHHCLPSSMCPYQVQRFQQFPCYLTRVAAWYWLECKEPGLRFGFSDCATGYPDSLNFSIKVMHLGGATMRFTASAWC